MWPPFCWIPTFANIVFPFCNIFFFGHYFPILLLSPLCLSIFFSSIISLPLSVSFFLFHSLYLSLSFCLPFSMSFSPSCFLTKSIFIICDVLLSLHLMFWLFHLLHFYSSSNVFSNLQALTFPSSLNKKETIRRKIKI